MALENASRRSLFVVECKQYWKPAAGNFRAALVDYARAHTEAMILLANYGTTPASIAQDLGLDDPARKVMAFGEVHPLGTGLVPFRAAVVEGLDETGQLAKRVCDEAQAAARLATQAQRDAAEAKARSQAFDRQAAEVAIRLSWNTGGDLDLRASAHQNGEIHALVSFGSMGDLLLPPYAMLDRDDLVAPGRETIKLGAWHYDWVIEVRRHQGSWPREPVRVEVVIGRQTRVYERLLQASDGDRCFVCTIDSASKSAIGLDSLEPSSLLT